MTHKKRGSPGEALVVSPEDTANADVNNSERIQRKEKKKGRGREESLCRTRAVVTEKPREQKKKKSIRDYPKKDKYYGEQYTVLPNKLKECE